MGGIEAYYDGLAHYYKLIYRDWEASVARQAEALDGLIREFFGPSARRVLDAACGIGTQCLGLAERGYHVAASDISPAEIAVARAEAERRGLVIDFGLADMRQLSQARPDPFDVVLACDNAIPHLLSEADILRTVQEFHRCTTPKGGCLISVRDYARLEERTGQAAQQVYPRKVHVIRGGRYYCVTLAALERLLRQAGFGRVVTLTDRFFQPLLVALKRPDPPG